MSLVLMVGGAAVAISAPAAAATFSGSAIVNAATASNVIGTPYLWGGGHGSSVWTPGHGIDCSGLTRYAYSKSGIDLGSGATYNQIRMFDNVGAVSNAVPGDLIFYGTPNAASPDWGTWDVTHVAIYLGSGSRVDALPSGGVQVRSTTSMTRIGYFHIKAQYASGGSSAPAPRAPVAGEAWEAASTNSWTDLPMGPADSASVAATSMNGVKYVYTLVNGVVWEAASDNGWTSLSTGIQGASAVAATSMNGVKYIYTNVNGQVWEAASNNAWINQPTGIPAGTGLAVTSMNGVKYVYTLVNGVVWEAASNNSWISQPTGVPGSGVSVTSM
jgi:cell wall-associated NlpC family hydrolase